MCICCSNPQCSENYDLQGYGYLVTSNSKLKLFKSKKFSPVHIKLRFNILSWDFATRKNRNSDSQLDATDMNKIQNYNSIYSLDDVNSFGDSHDGYYSNNMCINYETEIKSYKGAFKMHYRIQKSDVNRTNVTLKNRKHDHTSNLYYLIIENKDTKLTFAWLDESTKSIWSQFVLKTQIDEWFHHVKIHDVLKNLRNDDIDYLDQYRYSDNYVKHI